MVERVKNTWHKYYKPVSRFCLFFIAITVVTYLLPKTSKFGFEYTKGTPWKHQLLIAPFDFAIYKTQTELNREKDSLLTFFRPYFLKDSMVGETMCQELINSVNRKSEQYLTKYPQLNKKYKRDSTYYECLTTCLQDQLELVYKQGIILLPEEYIANSERFELMLIEGSFVEPYQLAELNLQAQAYQKILRSILSRFNNVKEPKVQMISEIISDIELNKYIKPNILLDENRNNLEKESLQEKISLTSGRVLAGQRIIDQGEIVDDNAAKILNSFKREFESKLNVTSNYYQIISGQAIIILFLFVIIYLFMFYFRHDMFEQISSIIFILLITTLLISLSSISTLFPAFPIFVVPFTILPIIIRTFFDSRLAFFMYVITVLISAFFALNSFQFVLIQIPAGLVAVYSLFRMVRRSHIVRAALLIFLSYSILYTALFLWNEGDITKIELVNYAYFAANAILVLLVYPLIYIFERLFGFLSDVTLVELSDTNHPILRKLAESAPGTFQHSIQVGNLAQEVAYKINANPALVRAGAMYHDIGKMASPLFFTENQAAGINLHNGLDFEDSAQIVINHIENGVKMARKNKVPQQVIDFITTHQGTTKTWYFYNSYVNANPDANIDEGLFTYPGPTPFTKETAILMMADSIEAASRSLKTYNDEAIDKLVEKIIDTQIKENQFINAPITFREITEAKTVFKTKLKNIYHARIEYPDIKKKKTNND